MRKVPLTLGLLALAVSLPVLADEFKAGHLLIDIPPRFEGPVSSQPDGHSTTYAFTVRAVGPVLSNTVLQITVYDIGNETYPNGFGPGEIAQRYLSQMLQGVERRRTAYQQSASKEIRLADFPGSVVSWQGKANGIATNGTMFCIATKSDLLFFHVMGGGNSPNADMAAAIKAVENARNY